MVFLLEKRIGRRRNLLGSKARFYVSREGRKELGLKLHVFRWLSASRQAGFSAISFLSFILISTSTCNWPESTHTRRASSLSSLFLCYFIIISHLALPPPRRRRLFFGFVTLYLSVMVVTVSSSYSSPDFKAHLEHSTSGSYRIPRKPPPAIDISERYPSPDPADPFAPLWVLRNRTSSNLMNGALRVEDSQETLDNPLEQRHIVYPTPPSTTTSNGGANRCALGGRRNSYSRTSPPASPSPTKGYKSKPGAKMAHYKTYSQLNDSRTGFGGLNTVGTLQAFPRIVPLGVAQLPPHIDFASPKPEQRPWSPNIPTSREASASPQSRIDPANFADSTWSSDSDDDEDDDEAEEEVDENASINPSAECKPSAYISSPHRHQSSQSISNPIGRTADSRSRSSSASPRSMKGSSPKMLTKFLFPRKMSVLNEVNLGGGRAIPGSGVGGPDIGVRENLASRGLTGRRTTASTSLDYRHVTKSSISAPQPFVLPKTTRMGVREPSANIMPVRGRVDTTYKNGLDLDGSLGQKTTNDASHGKLATCFLELRLLMNQRYL